MKIKVKVISGAHKNIVEKCDDETYTIRTTAISEKGKANKMVIKLLADYFEVAKSEVRIIQGIISRNKIIEIDDIVMI